MGILVLKPPHGLLGFVKMVNGTEDNFFSRRGKMLAVMVSMAVHLDDSPINLGILKQHCVKEASFRAEFLCTQVCFHENVGNWKSRTLYKTPL